MNYFPYIFLAYLLAGVVLVSVRSRTRLEMDTIRRVLEETSMAPAIKAPLSGALIVDVPGHMPSVSDLG